MAPDFFGASLGPWRDSMVAVVFFGCEKVPVSSVFPTVELEEALKTGFCHWHGARDGQSLQQDNKLLR